MYTMEQLSQETISLGQERFSAQELDIVTLTKLITLIFDNLIKMTIACKENNDTPDDEIARRLRESGSFWGRFNVRRARKSGIQELGLDIRRRTASQVDDLIIEKSGSLSEQESVDLVSDVSENTGNFLI